MVIIIDTREQRPYGFSVPTIRRKLDAGDYSIEGYESVAAVERKELNDYVQTVIYQKERFRKELKKLAGYRLKAIVVEASMSDILSKQYEGHISPVSVIGATVAIHLSYGVPIHFCSNRQIAVHYTETLLTHFYEHETGRKVRK
ncbi:MAG TPA: ERCC4 domain-containing protein [Geobacteraceae bacterium]|nr:ERCC4 domain-containing protein [Geobacteraceae bacterium]